MKKIINAVIIFIMFAVWISSSFAEEVNQLKLNWVDIIWKNIVELEFDSNIDKDSKKNISVIFCPNFKWYLQKTLNIKSRFHFER